MTRRHDLEQHRHSLGEIREIMNSMKTLAYMETRKLAKFIDTQQGVIRKIEEIAEDFLGFYPELNATKSGRVAIYLLIGSERGFCGDFNHRLVAALDQQSSRYDAENTRVVAVGHRLSSLFDGDQRLAASLTGASVAEEVTATLSALVSQLSQLQGGLTSASLYSISHSDKDEVVTARLIPPFAHWQQIPPRFTLAPLLNQTPEEFFTALADQYLLATLHGLLYSSLAAENQKRVTHLEGAARHLDEESETLARLCNTLRQEEITEEIEVLLLNRPTKRR